MTRIKRLLILGPSFRRNNEIRPISALERYDGVLNRIAKKYACKFKDLDVSVMLDDLTLVDSATFVPFTKPEGANWRKRTVKREVVEKAVAKNRDYLTNKLEKNKKYSEVFVSMGKKYAAALPDLAKYGTTILFPTGKGLGPKAAALKQWLTLK